MATLPIGLCESCCFLHFHFLSVELQSKVCTGVAAVAPAISALETSNASLAASLDLCSAVAAAEQRELEAARASEATALREALAAVGGLAREAEGLLPPQPALEG